MIPSDWENASTALSSAIAKPYLSSDEKKVGRRYAAELADAIRRFGVGADYFHEKSDPSAFPDGSPGDAAQARAFVQQLRSLLNTHFASAMAHWKPISIAIPFSVDANDLANGCKAALNAHLSASGVHFNDDGSNTVTAPDAVDDAALIVLATALRAAADRHIRNAGGIVFTQTNTAQAQGEYQRALADYQGSRDQKLALIAEAERVARAAQTLLGFSYSGGQPWENTPYGKLAVTFENAPKIHERLSNILEPGTYNSNEYVKDVVIRMAALIGSIGSAPTVPTPPGPSTLVVQGHVSSAAEAALTSAIANANQFAAAAAVQ